MPYDHRRRALGGYTMPAAVILTGVLVAVSAGLVVSKVVRSRNPHTTLPAVQAAAPDEPYPTMPDDQSVIPVPSATTTSASPSPTPTRTPPATPFAGTVSIVEGAVPAVVDLSAEGTVDWVHWGEQNAFSTERDADGKFAIVEGAPTAPRERDTATPDRFRWTGGSPIDTASGTPTGIHTCGTGHGFTLTAPATTVTRTLRLYVGAQAARGRLTARLSPGGHSATSSFEQTTGSLGTRVLTVTYRAAATGTLALTWTTESVSGSGCGGVALQAATLH